MESLVSRDNTDHGIIGPYPEYAFGTKVAIATCFAVAWYNAIEFCVILFVFFTNFRGLYFYSLLISAVLGVVPYALGFLLKFFSIMDTPWLPLVLLSIGWWCMTTGQAIVLWSRMHLMVRDKQTLRRVLAMILLNVAFLHVPTTVLTFYSNATLDPKLVNGYNIMEKIQMTGFFVQELVISSIYIWETIKMLRGFSADKHGDKRLMYQLLSINLIFILMDIGLVILTYMDLYVYETSIKATVYSVKLKLEFAVLGRMVTFVKFRSLPTPFSAKSTWSPEIIIEPNGYPDFVDPTRIQDDVSHAPAPPPPPRRFPTNTSLFRSDTEKTDSASLQLEHPPALQLRDSNERPANKLPPPTPNYSRTGSEAWSNGTHSESMSSGASKNDSFQPIDSSADNSSLISVRKNGNSMYTEWPG